MRVVLSALLAGLAAAVALGPPVAARRLRGAVPARVDAWVPAGARGSSAAAPGHGQGRPAAGTVGQWARRGRRRSHDGPRRRDRRRAAGPPGRPGGPRAAEPGRRAPAGGRPAFLLAGAALVLVVGGVPGAVLGAGVALAGPRLVAGLEPRAERARREQLVADLPLALDLLAACLAGGAPLPGAVQAVGEAVPGACGERLLRVVAALGVGTPPAEAWGLLAAADETGLAGSAGRALARAGEGGAPVGAAVAQLAGQARARAAAAGQQAAARAGVLAVGPLGLCFLPAFVLVGVVPVVAGLVGPLLSGW